MDEWEDGFITYNSCLSWTFAGEYIDKQESIYYISNSIDNRVGPFFHLQLLSKMKSKFDDLYFLSRP